MVDRCGTKDSERMVMRRWSRRGGGVVLVAVGALLVGCTDDYAERSLEEARGVAAEQGREVVIVWAPSDEIAPRTVIDASEGVDGSVRLRVSSGDLVPVPDLFGLGADEAEAAVEDLALGVRRRSDLARSGPFDVITRTDPAPDELVEPGATVTLFVREEERNRISGTLVLIADKEDLGGETLPTDSGVDSEDWSDRGPSFAGERCWGTGFYRDIVDGAQFIVRDASGTIVAKGELGRGRTVYVGEPDAELLRDIEWECHFRYAIDDVPFSEFYAIETTRNTLTYAFDELEALGWRLDLTIPIEGPPDVR
jgi:hypothetical protein